MILKRWKNKTWAIVVFAFQAVTFLWLIIELANYQTKGNALNPTLSPLIIYICIGLCFILSIYMNRPKIKHKAKLRNKDLFIEIRVGDAFKNSGALAVPFNNQFDLTLGGNVKKAKSLQNKLISDYYSNKHTHLKTDLEDVGVICGQIYPIGHIAEVEVGGKRFYLLVNSIKMKNDRVRANVDDLMVSLQGLWGHVADNSSRNKFLTIPLLNTGHGRDASLTKMDTAKEIISSYIEASKKYNVCETLIISIHPDDIDNELINLDDLFTYLDYQARYYREVIFAPADLERGGSGETININS